MNRKQALLTLCLTVAVLPAAGEETGAIRGFVRDAAGRNLPDHPQRDRSLSHVLRAYDVAVHHSPIERRIVHVAHNRRSQRATDRLS